VPKQLDSASENNEFYDLKLTTYQEEYDEKTDKTKEKIITTQIYSSSNRDFTLKYPFEFKQ
jgi:hypothetical protein